MPSKMDQEPAPPELRTEVAIQTRGMGRVFSAAWMGQTRLDGPLPFSCPFYSWLEARSRSIIPRTTCPHSSATPALSKRARFGRVCSLLLPSSNRWMYVVRELCRLFVSLSVCCACLGCWSWPCEKGALVSLRVEIN